MQCQQTKPMVIQRLSLKFQTRIEIIDLPPPLTMNPLKTNFNTFIYIFLELTVYCDTPAILKNTKCSGGIEKQLEY